MQAVTEDIRNLGGRVAEEIDAAKDDGAGGRPSEREGVAGEGDAGQARGVLVRPRRSVVSPYASSVRPRYCALKDQRAPQTQPPRTSAIVATSHWAVRSSMPKRRVPARPGSRRPTSGSNSNMRRWSQRNAPRHKRETRTTSARGRRDSRHRYLIAGAPTADHRKDLIQVLTAHHRLPIDSTFAFDGFSVRRNNRKTAVARPQMPARRGAGPSDEPFEIRSSPAAGRTLQARPA